MERCYTLVLGWLALTFVAHFGGPARSLARPHPWDSATVLGLVLTCVCFLTLRVFEGWRRS